MTDINEAILSENAALFERFRSALNLSDDEKLAWRTKNAFVGLIVKYSEGHRRYHGVEHIKALLAAWDLVKDQVDPDLHPIIETAIFYHDSVYDPVRRDNEEESYQLFKRDFGSVFDGFYLGEVADCIRGTVHDGTLDHDAIAARWVADIDLLSLSLIPELFDRNSAMIKFEYSHHPDFSETWWRDGQVKFLSSMLNRPFLFYNEVYKGETGRAAYENLTRLRDSHVEASF